MNRIVCLLFWAMAPALMLMPHIVVMAGEIRVMSFNLRYGTARDGENHWDRRKDFVAETIAAFGPDLLGTQETLGFQKEFLDRSLTGYTSIGVGRDDGGPTGEMTALFFKTDRFEALDQGHFWLSESPEVPGSISWDSSLTRMASWVRLKDRRSESGRPVLIINTHFDHRGELARERSAELIHRMAGSLGEGCDIVLTGDFNAAVDSPPYQALFQTNKSANRSVDSDSPSPPIFRDTYRVKVHSSAPEHRMGEATFSGFQAGVVNGARIDWIAVAGQWQIISAKIDRTARDGSTPSDHYPVTATLRQKP